MPEEARLFNGRCCVGWLLFLNKYIVCGTLALHEWEEGYGHCIMGLCQIPQAILPSEIRRL